MTTQQLVTETVNRDVRLLGSFRLGSLMRGSFARHSSIVLGSTIAVNVFNYLFHTLASRHLGPAHYGELATLLSIFLIVSIPGGIISMVTVKYVAEFYVLGEPEKVSILCWRIAKWICVSCLALTLLLLAASGYIAGYLHLHGNETGLVLGFLITSALLLSPFRGALQGVEKFSQLAVSMSLEALGKLAFGIVPIYLGWGVAASVWGIGLGSAISAIYTAYAVYRNFGYARGRLRIDLRRLIKSSATVALTLAAITVLGFADILFVKHYFSAADAGVYGVASLVGKGLYFLVSFAPVVVLPRASLEAARGRAAVSILVRAGIVIALLAACILGVLVFFAPQVVTLLAGHAFAPAAGLLLPYGLAMAFLAMANLVTSYRIGAHRPEFIVPLLVVASAEIIALQFLHQSLMQFVATLAVGHFLVLCSTLFGFATREAASMKQLEHTGALLSEPGDTRMLSMLLEPSQRYLVILPTYNELSNISVIIKRVLAASSQLHVLVIDDQSPDGTADLVRQISEETNRVSLITRSGKLGLGSAYLVGFRYAIDNGFSGACTMDADNSHDPAALPGMIQRLGSSDLVIGSRYVRGGSISHWNAFRRINSWVANTLARLSISTSVKDCTSGYRLYSASLLSRMNLNSLESTGYSMLVELLDAALKRNACVSEYPIHFENRSVGESKMGSKEILESLQTYRRLRFARPFEEAVSEEKVAAR